ncbi:MAG: hypothetical protein KAT65_07920 [Methanophagales archaeon]|nr:hypothetical protein [Methanophagales archaeon]
MKKREMRYNWEKYNWGIYCIIIAIAVFLILYCAYPNTDQDNARYILSAISQGLAAILALVFTITLVVAQMTRRYTAMDKIIFRLETILLMIVFGIGVVTPLLVLKFGLCRLGISLSIALAFFCVFSLLPFLKGVNGVLKYDIGIVNLNEEIMEAIELGYEPRAINKIKELNDMGKDAVKEFREDAVRKILNQLSGIGKKSAEKRFEYATSLVVGGLREIGIGCIENGFDGMTPETPEKAVTGLKDIGVAAAKNGSENLSKIVRVADGLKDVGVKAAENRRVRTTINAVRGLKDVCMEIKPKELNDIRNKEDIIKNKNDREIAMSAKYTKIIAVDNIWCLGAFVTEYMPDRIDLVIENLKEIKEEIGRDLLMPYEKDFIKDHPNLKSALEKFKRRYTER